MNNSKYNSALLNANSQTNKLWIALFISLVIIILLGLKLYATETSEKTIVVPSSFNKPFSVKGDDYSNEYKEQVALFILDNLLTFQPSNAKYQFGEVLRWVHPNNYPALKAKLNAEARKIIADSSSSVFYKNGVSVRGNEVVVRGEIVGFVGGNEVSRRTTAIKLPLDTQNGFYITGWTEVPTDVNLAESVENQKEETDLIGDVQ